MIKHVELERSLFKLHEYEYETRHNPYSWKLRASSLPVCKRMWVFHHLIAVVCNSPPLTTEKFILTTTGATGTSVHSSYQRMLGLQKIIYGDWLCKRCGIIHRLRLGQPYCMNCGSECEYQELQFFDSLIGASGHGDGLVPLDVKKFPKDPRMLVFDIKTGKEQDVEPVLAKSFLDRVWEKWMTQVGFYTFHLRHRYKFHIVGAAILVVNRNRPWRARLVYASMKELSPEKSYMFLTREIREAENHLRHVLLFRDVSKLPSLEGACSSAKDAPDCPWHNLCFGRGMVKEVKEVMNETYSEKQQKEDLRQAKSVYSKRFAGVFDPVTIAIEPERYLQRLHRRF